MYLLLIFMIGSFAAWSAALSQVRVSVPEAVSSGDPAVFQCVYDLEADSLYSVKWYKGRQEFYRFTPKETPPIKTFPIPGVPQLQVQVVKSNATQMTLRKVVPALSGSYSCEVSADAPSFQTALITGKMDVVTPPKQPPSLHGLKPRYEVGDKLRVNCTSADSWPAANLSWKINDQQVDKDHARVYHIVRENGGKVDLESATSILEKSLVSQDFNSNNRLKRSFPVLVQISEVGVAVVVEVVMAASLQFLETYAQQAAIRCAASIFKVYWKTTEKSAELERPKGTTREHQSHPSVLLNLKTDDETLSDVVEHDPTSVTVSQTSAASILTPLLLLELLSWRVLVFQDSFTLT